MIAEYRGSEHDAIVSVFNFPFKGSLKNTDTVFVFYGPLVDGVAVVREGKVVFKQAKTPEVLLALQNHLETAVLK